jgi:hypothetical protein
MSNIVRGFGAGVDTRKAELDYIYDGLSQGLATVSDHDSLNATIEASSRPDLMLTDPVPQIEYIWPFSQGRINNFTPSMQAFGMRVFMDVQESWEREPTNRFVGRRQLNEEDKALYFLMGARGDYHQHNAFAEVNGVDEDVATDMMMQSHVTEGAFMRMWIALPELTEHLMAKCLNEYTPEPVTTTHTEEIFVAYSVMSKLVDAKDTYVLRKDGTLDDWRLCR